MIQGASFPRSTKRHHPQRTFDRGLITMDAGYRVKVSAGVIEDAGHAYSLKQFNGQPIHLPADNRCYPDRANLEWHGGNVFKREMLTTPSC